jgi:mannobiose 2-epimerase
MLPYWAERSHDDAGGYLVVDDLRPSRWRRPLRRRARPRTPPKQLVSQARFLWTFSHAHRKGFVHEAFDYRAAAERGYRFLLEHFLDAGTGGYRWMTDRSGRPVNDARILYGQAFVIYAFVEFARACGDPHALDRALDLHRVVDAHLHDGEHGGWFEHAGPDWALLGPGDPRAVVEIVGLKSANAQLHWLEALTELYVATGCDGVRASLAEALHVNRTYLYPAAPGRAYPHRRPDWSAPTPEQPATVSYGHNVEFAWLMIRAQRALGVSPSWDHFSAHLDHALRLGVDRRRGGVYRSGVDDRPATDTDKVWWVQAEMVTALTEALRHHWSAPHAAALLALLDFVERHQTDRVAGIWLEAVSAAGRRRVPRRIGPWKDGYHDLRALVRLIEAFEAR